MRILVLTDLYPPYFLGGYELKCKLHVEELQKRGHQVFILASRWKIEEPSTEGNVYRLLHYSSVGPELDEENPHDRLRLHRRYEQFRRAWVSRKNYAITRKMVADLNPDVAYIWSMARVSASPVLAVHDQQVPAVFRIDDYWLADLRSALCLQSSPLKRRYRVAIEGLSDFGCLDTSPMLIVSHFVRQKYVERGFAADKAVVVPEGVPLNMVLDRFDAPNTVAQRGEIRLVHVGRIVPDKGAHVAIEALAHLVGEMDLENSHLDIIGTGPEKYMGQLHEMTVRLGLEHRVHFVGFLQHREVLERFARYDAALIPSLWPEPLAGTIAEAMARGLPVIATNCGGSPEIISDGENGFLVPPGDSEALAHAIGRLVQTPELWLKFRRQGLNTVRKNYVHERIIDQVEAYLHMTSHHIDLVAA